jgi:hypothetical protein
MCVSSRSEFWALCFGSSFRLTSGRGEAAQRGGKSPIRTLHARLYSELMLKVESKLETRAFIQRSRPTNVLLTVTRLTFFWMRRRSAFQIISECARWHGACRGLRWGALGRCVFVEAWGVFVVMMV